MKKIIIIFYAFCIPISSLFIFLSTIFVYDGTSMLWIRHAFFISSLSLPILLLISIIFSKKSSLWLLLPLFSIVSFLFFGLLLDKYTSKSNIDYCKKAEQNDYVNIPAGLIESCRQLLLKDK